MTTLLVTKPAILAKDQVFTFKLVVAGKFTLGKGGGIPGKNRGNVPHRGGGRGRKDGEFTGFPRSLKQGSQFG